MCTWLFNTGLLAIAGICATKCTGHMLSVGLILQHQHLLMAFKMSKLALLM